MLETSSGSLLQKIKKLSLVNNFSNHQNTEGADVVLMQNTFSLDLPKNYFDKIP